MKAKTYFISDCHLEDQNPEVASLFLRFLQEDALHAQALYLLGDLFNVWIGDDVLSPLGVEVQRALSSLSQRGVKLYFMAGNRDFLMGQAFLRPAGVQCLPDPSIIDLYGKRVLLCHGDTLCTQDRNYQRYRFWVRQRLVLFVYRSLPLSWRQKIAQRLRQESKNYQRSLTRNIMDVCPQTVEKFFKKHQVDVMIHGHTHRPAHHQTWVEGQKRDRWVLGDWHPWEAQILCASPEGMQSIDLAKRSNQDFETGNSTGSEIVDSVLSA